MCRSDMILSLNTKKIVSKNILLKKIASDMSNRLLSDLDKQRMNKIPKNH